MSGNFVGDIQKSNFDYTDVKNWLVDKGFLTGGGGVDGSGLTETQIINLVNSETFLTNLLQAFEDSETFLTDFATLLSESNEFLSTFFNSENVANALVNFFQTNETLQDFFSSLGGGSGGTNPLVALDGDMRGSSSKTRWNRIFGRYVEEPPEPAKPIDDNFDEFNVVGNVLNGKFNIISPNGNGCRMEHFTNPDRPDKKGLRIFYNPADVTLSESPLPTFTLKSIATFDANYKQMHWWFNWGTLAVNANNAGGQVHFGAMASGFNNFKLASTNAAYWGMNILASDKSKVGFRITNRVANEVDNQRGGDFHILRQHLNLGVDGESYGFLTGGEYGGWNTIRNQAKNPPTSAANYVAGFTVTFDNTVPGEQYFEVEYVSTNIVTGADFLDTHPNLKWSILKQAFEFVAD